MRLPQLDHNKLSADQRDLYEEMHDGIERNFKGFTAINDNGDLIGPWNPWLMFSKFGRPVWDLVTAIADKPRLPARAREVAILVTGTHFHSEYELYAHIHVAELKGLSDDQIRTIVSGNVPHDLSHDEMLAYDFAKALVSGGVVPDLLYRQMTSAFGEDATAEFVYLVGLYCMVSITLNGFRVPLPPDGDR